MFNILLDELPNEWQGYPLNTDFRIGIMICLAIADKDLSEYEKIQVAISLLFVCDYPQDGKDIADCLEWFLNGWDCDNHKKSSGGSVESMDFDADQGRIFTAFIRQYQINLNTCEMHFWEFMHLLSNLEECSFTRVVDIRTKKLDSKMSKEERKHYTDAKRVYAIHKDAEVSEEDKLREQEVTDTFLSYIGKK